MTLDEANKLARVAASADGGCSVCVKAICEELSNAGLGYVWTAHNEKKWPDENLNEMLGPLVTVEPQNG